MIKHCVAFNNSSSFYRTKTNAVRYFIFPQERAVEAAVGYSMDFTQFTEFKMGKIVGGSLPLCEE